MNGLKQDAMFLCHLLHPWYPIISIWTLIGVIEDKTSFLNHWKLRTFSKFWLLCNRFNWKIHEIDSTLRYIRNLESFVIQKLWIRKKFPLPAFCTQNANPFLTLCFRITDTFLQQVIRIPMSLHGTRNP